MRFSPSLHHYHPLMRRVCVTAPCVCMGATACIHSYYTYSSLHIDFMSSPVLQQKHFALLQSINRERCIPINMNVQSGRINCSYGVVGSEKSSSSIPLLCVKPPPAAGEPLAFFWWWRGWPEVCRRNPVPKKSSHHIVYQKNHPQTHGSAPGPLLPVSLCVPARQWCNCSITSSSAYKSIPAFPWATVNVPTCHTQYWLQWASEGPCQRQTHVLVDLEEVWGTAIPASLLTFPANCMSPLAMPHTAVPTLAALELIQQQTRSGWNNVGMFHCG